MNCGARQEKCASPTCYKCGTCQDMQDESEEEDDEDEENEEATGEGCGWLSSKLGGRAMEPGTLDTKDPGDPPSDDDSIQAVWGDPEGQEVLEVTSAQELLYKVWWRIREEERRTETAHGKGESDDGKGRRRKGKAYD